MRILAAFILILMISIESFSLHSPNQHVSMDNYNFTAAWAQVDEYSGQNLPESALKLVDEIYRHAKSEDNAAQLVKAVIYTLSFTELKEEDAFIQNLNRLKEEAEKASFPEKPLLHSMLAQLYWSFYQENIYQFNQRSETVDFKNDDISTWSLDKLVQEATGEYLKSLEFEEQSKATKIDVFDAVLSGGNNLGKVFRPTLYDFLAYRALGFFMSEEPAITRPADIFTINSPEYLRDAASFASMDISSLDTLAFKYHALKIYQGLIRMHLNDPKPEVLISTDLQRLETLHRISKLAEKDQLYLEALKQLEEKYIHLPYSTLVTYNRAVYWGSKGNDYSPLQSENHKWDKKTAWDICQQAIDRFPDSDGAALASNYQKELKRKQLSSTLEQVNVPEKPFLALVSYKNINRLYWRIIPVTRDEVFRERDRWQQDYTGNREKKFLEYFLPKSPAISGVCNLPDDGDLQEHSVEIKLEGLPAGDYMLIFSPEKEFGTASNYLSYAFTTISNLAYLNRNLDDGSTEMLVLDRTSGEPVAGAVIQPYSAVYHSDQSMYILEAGEKYSTDNNGSVIIPFQEPKHPDSYPWQFFADISTATDKVSTMDLDKGFSYYGYSGQIRQRKYSPYVHHTQTVFFTDRSIYRPGQTVYFKGLVFRQDGLTNTIVTNQNFRVAFYDVNNQEIASKELTTNEYGTFNGTFTCPASGLMGRMQIQMSNGSGSVTISVEEYKRPKFEVSFDPVKGSFRLEDTLAVKGKATAYSGANIDGAKVKFRVVRKARFPYWWWCWYGYYPSSPEIEITNGYTQTDENGAFTIDFIALPDAGVNKASVPVFTYSVYADVTDINGETHSDQAHISVGYKSLELGVDMKDTDRNQKGVNLQKFGIISTNLAGEFEPARGEIKIWKLKMPEQAYRNRMWAQPDRQALSEEEFRKHFPDDPYADEGNYLKWEKEEQVLSMAFNTADAKDFNIANLSDWSMGKYLGEISGKDAYGEEVREVFYFDLNDSGSDQLTVPMINYVKVDNRNYEPGDTAKIEIGSSGKITAVFEIEKDGKILVKKRIRLDGGKQVVGIPVLEEYRGNVALQYAFIKDNRLYQSTTSIAVPWTNKDLKIEFQTFRDKLQPGEQESWKIKIFGPKSDLAAAEMVATLYDASLDAFMPHSWVAGIWQFSNNRLAWQSVNGFVERQFNGIDYSWNAYKTSQYSVPSFSYLNWFGLNRYYYMPEFSARMTGAVSSVEELDFMMMEESESGYFTDADMSYDEVIVAGYGTMKKAQGMEVLQPEGIHAVDGQDFSDVKIRKNFNETAFFYPDLMTDDEGNIILKFTVPEALTRWKMLGFAHTKDLKTGMVTNELVTQKDLMVVPNQPRFFRENDTMFFSAKITSMTDKDLRGEARLEFFDALTMAPIDHLMKNEEVRKSFSVKARQSTSLEWSIAIPEGVQAITYRIVAKAGDFSDGEEMTLPVVTNRTLVTETLPLPIRGKQTKKFRFDKLADNTSTTLKHQRYTLEFTSNPAWYAVQALPYMIEYPYECTEQTFSRYYANAIATHIANSNPKIKQVFDTWASFQPDALLSNLEKNQELKSALLEETPWVLNAGDETQRKRNVALLFDMNRMSHELESAIRKIQEAQTGNGGFPWFKGMPEDRYITQYIVTGMGHLEAMGVNTVRNDSRTWNMLVRAIAYVDREMEERYHYLQAQAKKGQIDLEKYKLGYTEIQYLYMRSYFKDVNMNGSQKKAFEFFLVQGEKFWQENSIYMQGMVALALHRYEKHEKTAMIIKSLKERALQSEEMGMYWKSDRGYYWYQAPVETQALMIEVFDEVAGDREAVEELKVWLLKQKQTQDWRTTKATAEACYALLRRGMDMLAGDNLVEVTIGKETIDPLKREDTKVEAGTGYFKTAWTASEITPEMGEIRVKKSDEGVAWGAVYWQYFEQLDKITPAETPLSIKKQLFLEQNTDRGPVITPVTEENALNVGDLVKVRIEIRVDRDMEYVHLKDMRAAGFEPTETLSTYKYQDGLWYYQSTRDLSTNFFIGWLPKGTYVFEYPLRVSQKGDFSNGITTMQCMYAPEFSSHSEGIRVKME
ncbi:MAG: hypothetical protein JW801_18195 [Bacteroidales bacterium]|nr:hypothetical protein [Bacteroidales bacterium]